MASKNPDRFPFPILIGDIGGTNARFALLDEGVNAIGDVTIVQTANYPTIDAAIEDVVLAKAATKPRSTILAVAGPINGDEIPLTNCPWVVRPKDLLANLGFEDVVVINDFEAQALAVATLEGENQIQIGRGMVKPNHSKVVLGPGTGLGVAGLVHALDAWIPVPGEGGHVGKMHRDCEAGVEPPVAPRRQRNRRREQQVEKEEGVSLPRRLGRLAVVEPDGNQEERCQNCPAKRNDARALILKQLLDGPGLQRSFSPGAGV